MEWAWKATFFFLSNDWVLPFAQPASEYIGEHVPALYRKRKSKREEWGEPLVSVSGEGTQIRRQKKELASSVIIFTLGMDADCRFPTPCSTGTS
jgi:hypothetical protein